MAGAKRRRAYGTGSIRVYQGQFIARLGRRAKRCATRPEAEATLKTWLQATADGLDLTGGAQAVRLFLAAWLSDVAAPRVRPGTLAFYRRHLEYAVTHIGNRRLDALSAAHIQRMLTALQRDGLSAQSVAHVLSVLRNALNTAVKWKFVRENVAALCDPPRRQATPKRALSPEQVATLLAAAEGHRLAALYHVALRLGLRRGELLGLRWADLDWASGTLAITQQVIDQPDAAGIRRTTITPYLKTSSSRRTLPLTPTMLQRLRTHWGQQQTERELLGVEWREHGLIFPSERGTPLQPNNLSAKHFKRLLLRAGLPTNIRFHDLRHTALSDLAAYGEAKTVQALAGHASITTTMDLYAAGRIGAMREVVEHVERAS